VLERVSSSANWVVYRQSVSYSGLNILLFAADAEAGGTSLFEGYLSRKAVSSSTPRAEKALGASKVK
jgi:hypothetical protein